MVLVPIARYAYVQYLMARRYIKFFTHAYQKDDEESEQFLENRKRISISGVQEKLSILLDKSNLALTNPGEQR